MDSIDSINDANNLKRRLLIAGLMMLVIYTGGTLGYFFLGQGRWSLGDCAYMTVISLTTVGYGETLRGLTEVPYARFFTGFLLVLGAGIAVYFLSVLTTFFVEGEFIHLQRIRSIRRQIKKMNNHIIVCGVGGTGRHVVRELVSTGREFVAIDVDQEQLDRCGEKVKQRLVTMLGDATDDNVLLEAGIDRAGGIVASLPDDMGNLYVVVTARGLNPAIRIVAKAVDPAAVRKLEVAGADSVVSVNKIGGLRMVSEMIRPSVVDFLDKMMRDQDKNLRFEEIVIPAGSSLDGVELAKSGLRGENKVLIVAAKDGITGQYVYSPGGTFRLKGGMTLIVLGESESVVRLSRSPMLNRPTA